MMYPLLPRAQVRAVCVILDALHFITPRQWASLSPEEQQRLDRTMGPSMDNPAPSDPAMLARADSVGGRYAGVDIDDDGEQDEDGEVPMDGAAPTSTVAASADGEAAAAGPTPQQPSSRKPRRELSAAATAADVRSVLQGRVLPCLAGHLVEVSRGGGGSF